jgi:hypothetical protein
MERLFYILEGAVDHDDALNHITGSWAPATSAFSPRAAAG